MSDRCRQFHVAPCSAILIACVGLSSLASAQDQHAQIWDAVSQALKAAETGSYVDPKNGQSVQLTLEERYRVAQDAHNLLQTMRTTHPGVVEGAARYQSDLGRAENWTERLGHELDDRGIARPAPTPYRPQAAPPRPAAPERGPSFQSFQRDPNSIASIRRPVASGGAGVTRYSPGQTPPRNVENDIAERRRVDRAREQQRQQLERDVTEMQRDRIRLREQDPTPGSSQANRIRDLEQNIAQHERIIHQLDQAQRSSQQAMNELQNERSRVLPPGAESDANDRRSVHDDGGGSLEERNRGGVFDRGPDGSYRPANYDAPLGRGVTRVVIGPDGVARPTGQFGPGINDLDKKRLREQIPQNPSEVQQQRDAVARRDQISPDGLSGQAPDGPNGNSAPDGPEGGRASDFETADSGSRNSQGDPPKDSTRGTDPDSGKSRPVADADGPKGGPRTGTAGKIAVGVGLAVDIGNRGQDLVDYSDGKMSGKDVAIGLADTATGGIVGLNKDIYDKGQDRVAADEAAESEQKILDEARLARADWSLRRAGVDAAEVQTILNAMREGNDAPLKDKQAELRVEGTIVIVPERTVVEDVQGDESTEQRAIDVVQGLQDSLARAGGFAVDAATSVAEIPGILSNEVGAATSPANPGDGNAATLMDVRSQFLTQLYNDPNSRGMFPASMTLEEVLLYMKANVGQDKDWLDGLVEPEIVEAPDLGDREVIIEVEPPGPGGSKEPGNKTRAGERGVDLDAIQPREGFEGGALEDFMDQLEGQEGPTRGASRPPVDRSLDVSGIQRGQQRDKAREEWRDQGDYAQAQRLVRELDEAERAYREALAAEQQRQNDLESRRQSDIAYRNWLAKKQVWDKWAAGQRAQRRYVPPRHPVSPPRRTVTPPRQPVRPGQKAPRPIFDPPT